MKSKFIFLIWCGILLTAGVTAGIFYSAADLEASSPEGEISGGEQPASVYYDEHWQAVESYIATKSGYESFDPSTRNNTDITGEIGLATFTTMAGEVDVPYTILEPDMVVTKWKVHGHIHFEE